MLRGLSARSAPQALSAQNRRFLRICGLRLFGLLRICNTLRDFSEAGPCEVRLAPRRSRRAARRHFASHSPAVTKVGSSSSTFRAAAALLWTECSPCLRLALVGPIFPLDRPALYGPIFSIGPSSPLQITSRPRFLRADVRHSPSRRDTTTAAQVHAGTSPARRRLNASESMS